jgi:diguanylate cyclase (GGDEF)-like protein
VKGAKLGKMQIEAFEGSIFPVWIFDIDNARVLWANQAALELWEAETLTELMQRDMGDGMTTSVYGRLRQYQREFDEGGYFDESWTLYPKGIVKNVLCRFRGYRLVSGRMAMLCEAQLTEEKSSEVLRSSQALLYTGAMVTVYNTQGRCIYANPAALRALSGQGTGLDDRILSQKVLNDLKTDLMIGTEGQYVSSVKTQNGPRTHEIEARKGFDSVTGQQTLLLTELDIEEKEQAKRRVEHLANHDFLTGLHNRQYLTSRADGFIRSSISAGKGVFLLLIDLDRFKYVNDTFGHSIGDKLLEQISARLRSFFSEDAIISRFGGDEFCILLRSGAVLTTITRQCRDLVKDLKKPIKIDRNIFTVGASIGFAYVLSKGEYTGFDALLVKSDLALYSAKSSEGGSVRIFREKLYQKRVRFLKIEDRIASALQGGVGDLSLRFQPIVCLRTNKIVGLEALSRLRSKTELEISPSEFIPVAETSGLITELGGWVLRKAVEGYLAMPSALNGCRISVNVSPKQFHNIVLLNQLRKLAATPNFDPTRMELELTESALQIGEGHFGKMLQEIVEMGYTLAIDDFGSAYSNIARLNGYPVQTIKIDRSMMTHADGKLVSGAIDIVHALNLSVVAEGVETKKQSDWLVSKGCMEHQGFFYSKPLTLEEVKCIQSNDITSLKQFSRL